MNPRFPVIMGRPITRAEIIDALREGYDAILTLAKQADPCATGFPDMVAVLDYIEEHGLPPKTKES